MSEPAAGVVVTCGSCGSKLRLRGHADGKTGKCPKCGVRVQLAIPPAPAPPENAIAPVPSHEDAEPILAQAASVNVQVSPVPPPAVSPVAPEASLPAPDVAQPSQAAFAAASDVYPAASDIAPITAPAPRIANSAEIAAFRSALNLGSLSPDAENFDESDEPAEASLVPPRRASATVFIAVIAIASLLIGAAACYAVERFGGTQLWVVKRSIAAWLVGMTTAGAMIVASPRRVPALRFLAATTAAAAVIVAKQLAFPAAEFGPIDALAIALAAAGSTACFILAEPAANRSISATEATATT